MTIFTWKNLLANLWTNWLKEIESFAKGLEANTETLEFSHRAWFFCLTCFLRLRAGVCKRDSLPSLVVFFFTIFDLGKSQMLTLWHSKRKLTMWFTDLFTVHNVFLPFSVSTLLVLLLPRFSLEAPVNKREVSARTKDVLRSMYNFCDSKPNLMHLTRKTKEAYVSVQKNLFKLCICLQAFTLT